MNILLQNWEYPPFDQIKTEDYEPAIHAAIQEADINVEAIATSSKEPTFENTVEALECASRRLDRVSAIMMNLNECCTNEDLEKVIMKLEPLITRFSMKVVTDQRLYERVEKVWSTAQLLTPEQHMLLDNTLSMSSIELYKQYSNFVSQLNQSGYAKRIRPKPIPEKYKQFYNKSLTTSIRYSNAATLEGKRINRRCL